MKDRDTGRTLKSEELLGEGFQPEGENNGYEDKDPLPSDTYKGN